MTWNQKFWSQGKYQNKDGSYVSKKEYLDLRELKPTL